MPLRVSSITVVAGRMAFKKISPSKGLATGRTTERLFTGVGPIMPSQMVHAAVISFTNVASKRAILSGVVWRGGIWTLAVVLSLVELLCHDGGSLRRRSEGVLGHATGERWS